MFDPLSFVFPYAPTDRVIRVVNIHNAIVNNISICSYQKSEVFDTYLDVFTKGNKNSYRYDFGSNAAAMIAVDVLKLAVDVLKPNCKIVPVIPHPEIVTSITYAAYKSLYSTNSLIDFTWYDVTDTAHLFTPTVETWRTLAMSHGDGLIIGKALGKELYIRIDVKNDRVIDYHDILNNNRIINGGSLNLTNSTHCVASSNSNITAIDSHHIVASDASTVTVNGCENIKVTNNSTMTMYNCTSSTFDDIPLVIFSGVDHVKMDRNASVGKPGHQKYINLTSPGYIGLAAYNNVINNEFNYSTSNNRFEVILINNTNYANAIFRLKYTGTGINNTIKVGSNTAPPFILQIGDNEKDNTYEFKLNKNTGNFELVGIFESTVTSSKNVQVISPSSGQVNFFINPLPTQPSEMEMYINGIKLSYNIDFYYDSIVNRVVYTDTSYILGSSDIVEFVVY